MKSLRRAKSVRFSRDRDREGEGEGEVEGAAASCESRVRNRSLFARTELETALKTPIDYLHSTRAFHF